MKLWVDYRPSVRPSASPYRLLDEQGREIAWANAFLDAQRLRHLSLRSLRAYAYDLLHFARWAQGAPPQHPPRPLAEIPGSTLEEYVGYQLDQEPQPSPPTVNHRLGVVSCIYASTSSVRFPASVSNAPIRPDPRSVTANAAAPWPWGCA